ncbi:uncharacterized protein LOC124929971 [Impatiens glandulifera]|uniref:uncharacterized protein LOC124929971 n=1 Tax=Impatiens glandulifera TaxID=253017 RepID=UPI001FB0D362|nr:uncharacterized protein LOC124929971 [Impatiens glandulifera]
MTLKSIELSPASWMAIAWYPIYYIPNERHLEDLNTSFLTYHTLSSSFQDSIVHEYSEQKVAKNKNSCFTTLPPFGLASYRLKRDVWVNEKFADGDRMLNLHSAANSWLKQLSVQHHDFNFFTQNSLETGGIATPPVASSSRP